MGDVASAVESLPFREEMEDVAPTEEGLPLVEEMGVLAEKEEEEGRGHRLQSAVSGTILQLEDVPGA